MPAPAADRREPVRRPHRRRRSTAGARALILPLVLAAAPAALDPLAAHAGEALDGLRFVEWQSRDPVTLEGAIDGALSPNDRSHGADVYAAAILSDAVIHLERDLATGTLDSIALAPAPAGEPPLDGASGVAIAPDGSELLAVGLDDSRLFVYDRAPDGTLSPPETWNIALTGAREIAISPDGEHVYIADLDGDRLSVIQRLGAGAVAIVQVLIEGVGGVSGLDGPYSVTVSPDGSDVYVAGFQGHTLAHFDRDPATGELTQAGLWGNGSGGVDDLDGPLSVVVSDDGESLYVTSSAPGALFVFTRDGATGGLSFAGLYTALGDPHAGLLNAAGVLTRDGSVIVMGLIEHAVSVWRRTAPGALHRIETQFDDPPIVGAPYHVLAAPGEPLVFAFGPDSLLTDSLARYSTLVRDPVTGALTAVTQGDLEPLGFHSVDGAAISPDGLHVYLASPADDALLALGRVPGETALAPIALYVDGAAGIDGLANVTSVVVSHDGSFAYAAGNLDDLIARFARDPQTGALTWLGTTAAPAPYRLAQSDDGRHLYAISAPLSLHAFARDPGTGALTQVDVETEGVGGVTGLANPAAVAVSRDGGSVYVADRSPTPLLSVFDRDPLTGALTWAATHDQGDMHGASAVAVEAGGRHVYVAGAQNGTVVVYRRDPASGSLLYLRTEGDDLSDPLRLTRLQSLSVSPDGRHLYGAATVSRTVAVFSTDDIFLDGFEFGHLDAWSSFEPLPP